MTAYIEKKMPMKKGKSKAKMTPLRDPLNGGMITKAQMMKLAKNKKYVSRGFKELAKLNPALKKYEKMVKVSGYGLSPGGGALKPAGGGSRNITRAKKKTTVRGGKKRRVKKK